MKNAPAEIFAKISDWMTGNFNAFARYIVGDCRQPNIYFVTVKGHTYTMTYDFQTAYDHWKRAAEKVDVECTLEDRVTGVLASVQPESDEPKARLKRYDIDLAWVKSIEPTWRPAE